jgi:hypothetical protein
MTTTFHPSAETDYPIALLVREARKAAGMGLSHILHHASFRYGLMEPIRLTMRGNDAHRLHALWARYERHRLNQMVRDGILELRRREVPGNAGPTILRTYHLTDAGRTLWLGAGR